MVIKVIRDFILKCNHKTLTFRRGELYEIRNHNDLIIDLINRGLIIPEYVFDTYDWCINVCILTEGQARLCERANPCWRFEREKFIEAFIKKNGDSPYNR